MNSKKNVLVHAINWVWLWHIKRLVLIAKELRKNNEIWEIFFASNSSALFLIENEWFIVYRLDYGIEDTLKDLSFNDYERENLIKLGTIIHENNISIVIHDTYFIKNLLFTRRELKHFLVLRDSNMDYLKSIEPCLPFFKKVFIPHIQEEFSTNKQMFLVKFANVVFSWYVIEHNIISNNTINRIIISPWYWWDYENVKMFFEYINELLSIKPEILDWCQVEFVLWKHYERLLTEISFNNGYILTRFVEDLAQRIGDYRLFIWRCWYNTINEVVSSGTNSILFPVKTTNESQFDRINFFIKNFNILNINEWLYDKNIDSSNLERLIQLNINRLGINFREIFSWVESICNEIIQELKKENILVFKHIFLPLSENFIFEELSGFTRVNPIIFSFKYENIDAFNNSFECYYNPSFDELLGLDYPRIHHNDTYIKLLKYLISIIKKNDVKVIYTEFLFDAFFISRIKSLCKGIKIFSAWRWYDVYDFLEKPDFNNKLLFWNLDWIFVRDRAMEQFIVNKWYNKVHIIRSVLDLEKYEFINKNFDTLDILIGWRFVEKKNFLELIDLIKLLSVNWLIRKIGIVWDGKLLVKIISKINELGLSELVKKYGFLKHKDLLIVLKEYNCFINYSKKSPSWDDEGIPNLILENILSWNLIFSSITGWIWELLSSESKNSLSGDLNTDLSTIQSLFESKEQIAETIKTDYKTVTSMYAQENSILKLENKLLLTDI